MLAHIFGPEASPKTNVPSVFSAFCFLLQKCEAERTKFTEEIAKLKAEAAKRPSEAGKTASWAFQ